MNNLPEKVPLRPHARPITPLPKEVEDAVDRETCLDLYTLEDEAIRINLGKTSIVIWANMGEVMQFHNSHLDEAIARVKNQEIPAGEARNVKDMAKDVLNEAMEQAREKADEKKEQAYSYEEDDVSFNDIEDMYCEPCGINNPHRDMGDCWVCGVCGEKIYKATVEEVKDEDKESQST